MARLTQAFRTGTPTLNRAAGPAFTMSLRDRFATRLMTCLVGEPKFYGDTTPDLLDDAKEICQEDPVFALKAAIYAREELHLRTAPLLVLRWLLPHLGSEVMAAGIKRICTRPDQLVDLEGYYKMTQEKRALSAGLKRGIRDALAGYSYYQLAKYPAGLSRLIRLTHPPRAERFQEIIEDKIIPPLTWEVELTRHGNTAEVWDRLLAEDSVPYMALLRNLRNILQSGAKSLGLVCERLRNPDRVRGSKLFPFRFLAAYRIVQGLDAEGKHEVLEAINQAFALSAENLPHLDGRTIFLIDHSGSMNSQLSQRSSLTYMDIADTLAVMGATMCDDAVPVAFATSAGIVELPEETRAIEAVDALKRIEVGYGTSLSAGFNVMQHANLEADRVIVLSDMQAWEMSDGRHGAEAAEAWRSRMAPNAWIHSIDLAGYGTAQLQGGNISLIAGWSEQVLALLPMMEAGTDAFIRAIESVDIQG